MVTAELKAQLLKRAPKTKKFEGQRYSLEETQVGKRDAKAVARIQRKEGKSARVVKVGARYGIYTHT